MVVVLEPDTLDNAKPSRHNLKNVTALASRDAKLTAYSG